MKSFFDAFISYGRADSKAFAIKLHARLLEVGLEVWFDQNDIPFGVDYQNQIDDGIEKAHNFIFIIAPHSVKSPYCRKEIELAVKRNKRIIPLLHVKAHEFMAQTHPSIGKINWIWFQEGIDDFEASFSSLISLIYHQADYVKNHTSFLAKALDWERNQKQTSYLLIGEERVQAESWLKTRFEDEQHIKDYTLDSDQIKNVFSRVQREQVTDSIEDLTGKILKVLDILAVERAGAETDNLKKLSEEIKNKVLGEVRFITAKTFKVLEIGMSGVEVMKLKIRLMLQKKYKK